MGYARITVQVAPDGMTASLRAFAGPPVSEQDLYALLADAGVSFGIRRDAIARLALDLSDELFTVADFVVAEGERAEPGQDGSLVLAFATGIQPGHVRDDGTMDFHDRELLKPVTAGSVLAHVRKASAGRAGRRVDGSELPVAKTREFALNLGPGAALREDGAVVATRAGVVLYAGRAQLDVVQQHVHTGKVDLRSGHLDMEGSLVVRGDVERLFRASASGDVEVQGSVAYGSVHAGGSLRVSGGVRGGETGMVSAEGDIAVRHAEAAHIVCGGLLKLESAVNSELSARDVQVTGKLRGGHTRAEHGIVVREAGIALGAHTELSAAVPIKRPVMDAKRVVDRAKELRALVHKSARNEQRGKGGKAGRAAAALASAALERKVELAEQREALLPHAFIEVSGPIHPGVMVHIGNASLGIDEPSSGLRFSFDFETRQVRTERFVR
jgi:uncharacterized protein (DUF342 family)